MPLVLRTLKDSPDFTIPGVGKLPANGVGGVLLERAATDVHELQDGDGNPLEGDELRRAAEKFAKDRGWEVAEISDEKVPKLPVLAGGTPDRPPLGEVAEDHPFAKFASTAEEDKPLAGKALDDALDAAGLPKTGTADEKRARVAEHQELVAALEAAALSTEGTPEELRARLEEHQAQS